MKILWKAVALFSVLFLLAASVPMVVFAGGTLGDAVEALRATTGAAQALNVRDVDGDERIALPEAIYALESAAGLRDPSKEDPLFPFQWHLRNTGQKTFSPQPGKAGEDLRMTGAMAEGLDGTGIIVAVVDSGLELGHEDISANIVPGGSRNFLDQTNDPTPSATGIGGDHGTSVAGIIAAVARNGRGGRGVAPNVRLKGFNAQATNKDSDYVSSLGGSDLSRDCRIFNMSFGNDSTRTIPMTDTQENLYIGSSSLHEGKGAVYVKSSGNGYAGFDVDDTDIHYTCSTDAAYPESIGKLDIPCQNAATEEENSRPELIVVGALNANGVKASYSTPGAVLWISAPGGEYGDDFPAILTIDRSGCDKGYSRGRNLYDNTKNEGPANDFETGEALNSGRYNLSCNYTSAFNGTSSAAPNVSGAAALILQVNTNLSVREIKYILAKTARRVDSRFAARTVLLGARTYTLEQSWIDNAAGFHFHNWYGFGAIDVDAAITLARNWVSPLGAVQTKEYGGALATPVSIPDADADGITRQIEIEDNLTIENLVAGVAIDHPNTGETAIELTSPCGTKSILLNLRSACKSGMKEGAALGSNAFYGEKSRGKWTLRVLDGIPGQTGTLNHFALKMTGY